MNKPFPEIRYNEQQTIEMFNEVFKIDFEKLQEQDKHEVLNNRYKYSKLESITKRYK